MKANFVTAGLLVMLVASILLFSDIGQTISADRNIHVATAIESTEDGECSDPKSNTEKCNNKYVTNYIINGVPPEVVSCKLSPEFVAQICEGRADCQSYIDATIVEPLTNSNSGATAPAICDNGADYQYRGAVACFEGTYASNNTQVAAPIAAIENWQCCRKDDPVCSARIAFSGTIEAAAVRREVTTPVRTEQSVTSVGGGDVVGGGDAFELTPANGNSIQPRTNFDDALISSSESPRNSISRLDSFELSPEFSNNIGGSKTIVSGAVPGLQGGLSDISIAAMNTDYSMRFASLGTPQISGAGAEPIATSEGVTGDDASPYKSLQPSPSDTVQPSSPVQQFAWGTGLIDSLANFVRGRTIVNTVRTEIPDTEVVSTIPTPEIPETGEEFRNIKEIASDIASQKQAENTLSRVDHFAQTLTLVGGPNEVSTENKSFGRIQDLIIEDEAIRSLRLAEEEGKRAKNSTYCRAFETSEDCLERREERAKIVERQVFVAELEKRVLPENAVLHFLAVYDGWVRPTPAPATHATSTLGVLHGQDGTVLEDYEVTTDGKSLVSRIIDSIADAASSAVETLTNLITGTDTTFEDEVSN
ncbi:hypothetical protein JXR01_02565 [Candidatus Kaiserbacteria bacterium]|nr:MAG: hypothetical protein JXR01_02565 [Candidatus Kaiserbacteria bacterium]